MAHERAVPSVWTGVWLTIAVLAVCIGAFVIARGFVPATTRYFPLGVSAAAILFALADIARRWLVGRRVARADPAGAAAIDEDGEPVESDFLNEAANVPAAGILRYAGWFFGYLAAIWCVSLVVASGLFVAGFLRFEARLRWWSAVLAGAVIMALVILAGDIFHIRWPASLLAPLAFLT